MWPFSKKEPAKVSLDEIVEKKPAAKKPSNIPIVNEQPLYRQFQRIGGNIGPRDVSTIIREADGGMPARLVDLFHESREKDGHLQSICSTREGAVGLCDLRFVIPENQEKETEETKLCRRVVEQFENWPVLIEHLASSFNFGHATAVLDWKKTKDGLLLPYRAKPVAERNFVFTPDEGALRYSNVPNVVTGSVDLLAENPARIIQIQRRINGDVPVREGLSRLLCWSALFRNWSIRDWLALGEIGWKPWRIGVYQEGIDDEQINGLVKVLERVGSSGVAVIPDTMQLNVEWPQSNRASASGDHQSFFVTIGREMSKATLGTTSSVEESTLGDRAATQTRDQLRVDIRKRDAIILASFLRTQLFAYVISVNLGEDRPVPLPWFQADDAVDMVTFSKAVLNMSLAGVRIGQRWCRGEMGAPEPEDGEEVIGTNARAPGSRSSEKDPVAPGAAGGTNESQNQGTDPAAAKSLDPFEHAAA